MNKQYALFITQLYGRPDELELWSRGPYTYTEAIYQAQGLSCLRIYDVINEEFI